MNLIVVSSLVLNCNLFEYEDVDIYKELEDWPVHACQSLSSEYADVRIKKINQRSNLDKSDKTNLPGIFSIDPILAGRTKISWSSLDGNYFSEIYINVKAKKEVWTFKKNLSPGDLVKKRHIKMKKMEVSHIEGTHKISIQNPVGQVVRKRVKKGDVVTENMISEPPLIYKNKKVKISIETGKIKVVADATSLENGWKLGDEILVRLNDSDKSLKAIVSDFGEAYVDF